ncbi:MAG: hypothetical protein S4CHLAM6_03040 [Chlamydiae bacterium]|nr:hypothetical protein [Chlamydiota bacterium]
MAEGIPIGGSGNIGPSDAVPNEMPEEASPESSGQSFEKMVNDIPQVKTGGKPSPMNVAQSAQPSMQSGQVSAENLVNNMQQVLGQMQGLQSGLQTPNLKLNARTRRLLDAKLKRTKDNIKFIHSKVNVGDEDESGRQEPQYVVHGSEDENKSSVGKFLSYLTDGQAQLQNAMHSVSHLKSKKNPGLEVQDIFSMQIKLYRAQTEIEFSTAVLQKAIDDLKTLMNVQL